jgi:hypothetical protein
MMKNLAVIFLFITGFIACNSGADINTPTITDEPAQVEDTIPDTEDEIYGLRIIAGVSILFTDSNNVNVFDSRGKGWQKEDIKVTYVIPGQEDWPSFSYIEGFIPKKENGDRIYINFESRLYPYENNPPDKPWLAVCMNLFDKSEFTTTLLTFPNGSVDTIVGQRSMPASTESELRNVWYNGEQVLTWRSYSKEGTYPDGSPVQKFGEFQIIK